MANGQSSWVPSLAKRLEARSDDQPEQIRITGEFVDDMYTSLNRRLDSLQTDQATGFASVRSELAVARQEVKDETTSLRRAIVGGAIAIIIAMTGVLLGLIPLIR